MVRKGRATVWIDKEVAERLKESGIELSNLTSRAMEIVDSDTFADVAIELRLSMVDELINKTTEELGVINQRRENLNRNLADLQGRRQQIVEQYETMKNGIMLSRYTYTFNSIAAAAHYDIPTIMGNQLAVDAANKIKELSPLWQLDIHVRNLQRDMAKYG